MSNELPGYAVNQVLAGDTDCPRKTLEFLTNLHASSCILKWHDDHPLGDKIDGMKNDLLELKKIYEVVNIRGLAITGGTRQEIKNINEQCISQFLILLLAHGLCGIILSLILWRACINFRFN